LGRTLLVVLKRDGNGRLVAFVGSDLTRLPCFDSTISSGSAARSAAVSCAENIMESLMPGTRAHCILSHDGNGTRVVTCPLLHLCSNHDEMTFARWLSLDELGETPLYRFVAYALTHMSTYLPPSTDTSLLLQGTRGSRGLAAVLPTPLHTTPSSVSWALNASRIHQINTTLKECLLNPPINGITQEQRDYLRDCAGSVRPFIEDEIPPNLRGGMSHFEDPRLQRTPFPPHPGMSRTQRFNPPERQHTDYKPTSIGMILYARVIKDVADVLRLQIKDLRNFQRGKKVRSAKPFVVGQEGFLPPARGII